MLAVDRPNWADGFARSPDESEAPGQWDGLIGAWASFLGIQGRTLYDLSGRAHSGTLVNGASWVVGSDGYALQFNGSTGMVDVGDHPAFALTDRLSLIVWLRRSAAVATWDTVVGKERGVAVKQYAIDINANNFRFGPDDWAVRGTTTTVVNGVDYCVAVTYHSNDGFNGVRLYVNGILESMSTVGSFIGLSSGSGSLAMGALGSGSEWFNGMIRQVRLYARDLSPQEVMEQYRDPLARVRLRRQLWAASTSVASNPALLISVRQ
jgi:hypothetical protein